jgi:succinylarginine dihydrolase
MNEIEINFDGLVGPTHNYAGLAHGNLASEKNKGRRSNPKAAALEGLAKMKFLSDLGVPQAVLPPQQRPEIRTLRQLGFSGTDANVLQTAAKQAPLLLAACASASSMWAANSATVSPSADTSDGRVHITPANLVSQLHRSLEARETSRILRAIFSDENLFAHHAPLPATWPLADEGAANHLRIAPAGGGRGVEVFVYGRRALDTTSAATKRFPARQTLEASQAIARSHGAEASSLCVLQNPKAIDAGAFHNDVVAVANRNVLLYCADAWVDGAKVVATIGKMLRAQKGELIAICVAPRQVPMGDVVKSYLFNSQLLSLPDGSMAMVAPIECKHNPSARRFLDSLLEKASPIRSVHYVDVRQSMRNGGGPACLRLRVPLTSQEASAVHPGVLFTSELHAKLIACVNRHYRDRLSPKELADPQLLEESRQALDELSGILSLGSIYDFQ